MDPVDEGGDPACWSHLFDEVPAGTPPDPAASEPAWTDAVRPEVPGPQVVDLGVTRTGATGGAIWSLPHGGDLDANLVRLRPGAGIDEHVNDELDVLLLVQAGSGVLEVDGVVSPLHGDVLALVPQGSRRAIAAGPAGLTYLTVHRRRGPLTVHRDQRTSG